MKKFNRFLSVTLSVVTALSLGTVFARANTVKGDDISANWETFSTKFSSNTDKAIPRTLNNDLFVFEENENGGINVDVPDVNELPGAYSVSMLESNRKTVLDGLTVTLDPSEFSFLADKKGFSRSLCLTFTENKVTELYGDTSLSEVPGLYWGAQQAASNGLRHVLPTGCKSISVNIINQYWAERRDEHMATSVQLVYFDGETYNTGDGWSNKGDGRPGYRWSYYASQQSGESAIQDGFGRTIYFEKIYTGEGLTVSFRPDTTHGYVTAINGKEYCDGHDIMFFPDQIIPETMEEIDKGAGDVDFSAMVGVEGYLGIGSVGNRDDVDTKCDYGVVSVNGIPAAQWAGEVNTHEHTPSEETVMLTPDCLQFGISQTTCTECGAVIKQTVIDALDPVGGHDFGEWETIEKATVFGEGSQKRTCAKCGITETQKLKKLANPYTDLPLDKWYSKACFECIALGYMSGVTATTFAPNLNLTRAQFVQILAKVEGVDFDKIGYTAKFTDVPNGKWYSKAVTWAVDFGVTGGVGGGLFGPDQNVTRAQLASFLKTYASKKGIDTSDKANITTYADYKDVPAWAVDAFAWAAGANLISGIKTGNTVLLSPGSVATRAQVALIIVNLVGNILGK